MAPKFKRAEVATLVFIAVVRGAGLPDKLRLREHSLEFPGSDKLPGTVISGVYGTQAKNAAIQIAAAWNKELEQGKRRSRALLVDAQYRIDNMQDGTRQGITRESLEITGWLHVDRLQADFREELKQMALGWVREDLGEASVERLASMDLRLILLEHPALVRHLFTTRKFRVTCVVHPVRPNIAPEQELLAATVRYEPERFVEATARYLAADTEVVI